jgi:hypothetical protein
MSVHPQSSRLEPAKLGAVKEPLTFGDFVTGAYRVWGKRRARGMIHLAVKAHMIEFCGQRRYTIF